MTPANEDGQLSSRLPRYVWALVCAWTLIVGASAAWNVSRTLEETRELALSETRAHMDQERGFNLWLVGLGGVYVPVTEATSPNPALSFIPNRDIETPSGKRLTLASPHQMLPRPNENSPGVDGIRHRLTSLKPIDPTKKPDAWERAALMAFERGESEFGESVEVDGEPFLRLMQPLITEHRCLPCHARQGYKVGDIRGGLQALTSLAPFRRAAKREIVTLGTTHAGLWLLGLGGIRLVAGRLSRRILERDRAEHALRESQRQLSSVLDNSPDVIWIVDHAGKVLFVNRAPAGLPMSEVAGRSVYDSVSAQHRDTYQKMLRGVFAHGQGGDLDLVDVADSWFRTRFVPLVRGGKVSSAMIIATDITDGKRAEHEIRRLNTELEQRVVARTRELQESQIRFRQLAEHIHDVFWLATPDGDRALYVSPAYEEIWGRTVGSVDQWPESWLNAVHPDDRKRVAHAYTRDRLVHGEFCEEYRIVHSDGSVRWVLDRAFPVRNAEGQVVRIAGIAEDITDRKGAEEKARRHQAELAHVARVTAMSELITGLAHELNQPLCAIVTNAQAAHRVSRSESPNLDALRRALQDVVEDGKRAAGIIRGLRDFLMKGESERVLLDINGVIEGIAGLAEADARQHGARIDFNLADGLPPILGDRVPLQQVLLNLIRNGLEAMADTVADSRELTVRSWQDKDEVIRVCVRDNGIGLTDETSRRMFEPFFTTKPEGLGMGLAISSSIIEAHGGRLTAAPNPDRGTTFHVMLPCIAADSKT